MNRNHHLKKAGRASHARGLHIVALFEGAKGLLVLIAGFGVLSFIHQDIHAAALRLVEHIHLNPASHYPRIFLDLTEHITDARLWGLASAAALYSIVRMIEAAGLWLRKPWAEWFALLTGGIYIPLEIVEVARSITWPRVTVLAVNLWIVSYMVLVLIKNGRRSTS